MNLRVSVCVVHLFLALALVAGACGGGAEAPTVDAVVGDGSSDGPPATDAKAITAFGFLAANNPGLTVDVAGTIDGASITATVPAGTSLTGLIATFTTTGAKVTIGGAEQVSGTTAASFASPVTYRVTAADNSTQDYVVIVTVAPVVRKAIIDYRFLRAGNSVLAADIIATINGTSITATVPADTNVSALVATFTTTGESVAVGATIQVSGTTANNFAAPLTYRVTATDGSTQDYTVTITVAPRTAKAITAFSFLAASNAGLTTDVVATIKGTSITATLPSGTNVTALVATFATTGTRVTVGGVAQVSGTTRNNFTAAVTYRVTPADGTPQDYTVTVTVAARTAKAITAFSFLSASNPSLVTNVQARISGTSIAATLPAGTGITGLVATFTITGTGVTVAGTAQISGVTANDFATPVVYRVADADGATQDYTVTITIAPATAKAITAFSFLSVHNPGLSADVTATLTGTAIAATVPSGTDITALVATFVATSTDIVVGDTAQVSGATANSFAAPLTYRVTAADGSTQSYTVTVEIAARAAKAITAFGFLSVDNPALAADAVGTINGTAISVVVPSGTDVTALIATFATTGTRVNVGNTLQVSGTTANRFTGAVTYRVTAADNTTQNFTVTVTVAPRDAKAITSLRFLSANNAGLPADVTATIAGTTITATLPGTVNAAALVATFTTTGTSVTVAGALQASGVTANNFSAPVTYRVTAADGTSQDYVVAVTVTRQDAKEITSYRFLAASNPGLAGDFTASISGTTIAVNVPVGTNVTGLVATFVTTGAEVTVRETLQLSGTTPNSFSEPVSYRVTAADGSSVVYRVTVTVVSASSKEITDYRFLVANNPGLTADVVGTIGDGVIILIVPRGTNRSALIATFTTTGTQVTVRGVPQITGVTPNSFAETVTYQVTAADGTTKNVPVSALFPPSLE